MDFLKAVLKKFTEDARMNKRGFFTTFFKTTPEDYTDGEYVEIDIERSGDYVAPTLKDARTGSVVIDEDVFTEKRFKPPYAALSTSVPLMDLLQRQPGESDTAEVRGQWFGRLVNKLTKSLSKFHRMFKENIELQCAQILQTGVVTLKDANGADVYTLNFNAKGTHIVTNTNSWDGNSADPIGDLQGLCDVINDDGKATPQIAIFGATAWQHFISNAAVKDMVKRDGMNLGALNPGLLNKGGRYMGYIDVSSYRLECWVYNDSYKRVDGSTVYKFLDTNKVVITTAIEDLDFRIVFAGVPTLGMKEPFASVIPSEVTYDGFIRCHNRVFEDATQDTYTAESKMRALAIPVSIDRFGCLTAVH